MKHTLSILVENRFGELSRIVGCSAPEVTTSKPDCAESMNPAVSRITLVTNSDDQTIEQILRQVEKQVRVLNVTNMTGFKHIQREMALINVKAEAGSGRQEVLSLVNIFRAKVVDVSNDESLSRPQAIGARSAR